MSVGATTITQVVDGLAVQPTSTFTMARIERDREAALRRYKQGRDTSALERTMKRLDDEEREAQAATQVISAEEAVGWLQDLPALWDAADDSGRRLLTEEAASADQALRLFEAKGDAPSVARARGLRSRCGNPHGVAT